YHLNDLFAQQPHVEDAPDATALPRLETDIVFDNVSFGYTSDGFQLQSLNVRIPRGSTVAFVGSSGSGKSTVLNLLLRLYDPTIGSLRVDGRDIRTVTQDSLRAQIGMVFQECFLFNTSIFENIRMGKPDATPDQVMAAARAAEIHEFIATLPQGYNTIVGERGSQLSGGQRQRLAIARALVRDPSILVLDEATSALDYATEAALNETLLKVAQNRTVVMVTHRLSSVTSAGHIVVLDHGKVAEDGTHEQLLAKNGAYAALWRNQMQATEPVADLCNDNRLNQPDPALTAEED
ncbi:MAG TPA: ATP-binding cassette domain-containing protein, partial [Gemmataceae bacterium]|nr:ATP-binding cassette domain-containing protein [Gemmataceae bacterium]